MKWILVFIAALLSGLAIHLYLHLGFTEEVNVLGLKKISFHLFAKRHVGAYYQINATISEVEKWAINNDIPCKATFGYYLDNPKTTDEDRLRSEGGCIVNTNTEKSHKKNQKDFSFIDLPENQYLVLKFTGSPAIGPYKVYPKANKWMSKNAMIVSGPILEEYVIDGPNNLTTTYYFPVAKIKNRQ